MKPEALAELDGWLSRHRAFWSASFDRLAAIVETPITPPTKAASPKPQRKTPT